MEHEFHSGFLSKTLYRINDNDLDFWILPWHRSGQNKNKLKW